MSFRILAVLVLLFLTGCEKKTMLQEGIELYQKRDFKEALGFLEKSCIQVGGDACEITAYLYVSGRDGIKPNPTKALKALEFSCSYGKIKMCNIVYKAYSNIGLYQEAFTMLKNACNGGDYNACFELAKGYFWGKHLEKDLKKSLELAQKSCYGGSSEGCFLAITFYQNIDKYPSLGVEDVYQKINTLREKMQENIKNSQVLIQD